MAEMGERGSAEQRAKFNALADKLGLKRGKPKVRFDFSEVDPLDERMRQCAAAAASSLVLVGQSKPRF